MKKILKIVFSFVSIIILLAVSFISYLWVTEYTPSDKEKIEIVGNSTQKNYEKNKEYKVLTWNVGYFGMDKDIDFFMDGGKMIFPIDKEHVENNIKQITAFINEENADTVFLQEVDTDAKRTYHINQKEILENSLQGESAFAYDLKVKYMPYPYPPLGKMDTGVYATSKVKVTEAYRYQLPISFKFPVRLSNFKRAFTVMYSDVANSDKKVVMINSHLDAYDGEKSEGKIAQTKALLKFMEDEYKKGNYVILGADFNQTLDTVTNEEIASLPKDVWHATNFDKSLLPKDFKVFYDNKPTARVNNKPYEKGSKGTYTFTIDGFIVSNNIKVTEVKVIDKDYQNTDHNPVRLKFILE